MNHALALCATFRRAGVKSGNGFYSYTSDSKELLVADGFLKK